MQKTLSCKLQTLKGNQSISNVPMFMKRVFILGCESSRTQCTAHQCHQQTKRLPTPQPYSAPSTQPPPLMPSSCTTSMPFATIPNIWCSSPRYGCPIYCTSSLFIALYLSCSLSFIHLHSFLSFFLGFCSFLLQAYISCCKTTAVTVIKANTC